MATKKKVTATPKTKKTPRPKRITVGEFQAWLEGVEDALGTEWIPDAAQWGRIKEKIKLIKPDVIEKKVTIAAPVAAPVAAPMQARPAPQHPQQPPQSSLVPAPRPAPQQPRPAQQRPANGASAFEIDSSDGNYESPYA